MVDNAVLYQLEETDDLYHNLEPSPFTPSSCWMDDDNELNG